MDENTFNRLNQLSQQFYRQTAEEFNRSRDYPWNGWKRLLPYLRAPLSVLDVGCGNGRFGVFLYEQLRAGLRYHGLDSAPRLLEYARAALALPGLAASLEQRDVLEQPPDSGEFDLVALFGVLHHVPGLQQRRTLLHRLAQRVAPGGLLAFAAWRFYEVPRFRERIVPWPKDFDVEPNDYLLDWQRGESALRYCHYVDDAEHRSLIAASGLTEVVTYRADGRSGDLNCYSLLRRA
jgi:SAM-dependent methyltransferase